MNVTEMVLGAGALGTAAFGIVEAFKWSALGEAGFKRLKSMLGEALLRSLSASYGTDFELFLRAQSRNPEGVGELRRSLRQGMRIGLRPELAPALAAQVGTVDAAELTLVAERLMHGDPLDDALRTVLGRYELAVDARIDAGLTLAIDGYQGAIRAAASLLAIILALLAAFTLGRPWWHGALLGVAAVPLAPVAKDVVSALQAATRALRARS